MSWKELSDGERATLFEQIGAHGISRKFEVDPRGVYEWRVRYEKRAKRTLVAPRNGDDRATRSHIEHPGRLHSEVSSGFVIVASDCHYWPGPPSLMHKALLSLCKELKPREVILNGDVIDACTISRFPPPGWNTQPTVQEEIEAAQERLDEIEKASFKAKKRWTLGNHDWRFERTLATKVPELRGVRGSQLKHHFVLWEPCWSVFINDDVVVKHRFKGGIHAPHNNTLWSGKTLITGHLHSAKVVPFSDYNGTRYGVDTGCIADPSHRAFVDYTEDNPLNWRDAFCVLEFRGGRLLPPDLVLRWSDTEVVFRGEVWKP